ncbi:TPA: sigma 54-interacting transcriptional regulator [Enterococcus faecium]
MKRIDRVFQELLQNWHGRSKEQLLADGGTSASEIAKQLGLSRSNVSTDLNKLVREKKVIKIKSYPVCYLPKSSCEEILGVDLADSEIEVLNISELAVERPQKTIPQRSQTKVEKKNPFDTIIGHNNSLKKAISQARAAIYYPPNGLHMLLLGPTGSGKTFFANRIYQYAVYEQLLSEDAPFQAFNCADYYHNPQLLLSQLFGYCKGAFTGADEDYVGLVEKSDGGILLLDEIHRLPPEGQEMLFYFMDHGIFNRLGENDIKRKVNVLIIFATTENPNSVLLETFLRRIPMTIQIPSLSDRSEKERIELIKFLFANEAKRIQKVFRIDIDVMSALIQNVGYGNVGQLKSHIQLVCAQAFLNNLDKDEEIHVKISDLPDELKGKLLSGDKKVQQSRQLTELLDVTTVSCPNKQDEIVDDEYDNFNIYHLIEEKVGLLKAEGIPTEQIHQYILTDLHLHVRNFVSKNSINYNLLKFVEPKISELTIRLKEIAETELQIKFDRKFLYYIGMHIDAYFKRSEKSLNLDINVEQIKTEHAEEYRVIQLFSQEIESSLRVTLPEIEETYLTMLLVSIETLDEKKKVNILVVAHGDTTASSMVKVATELLGDAPVYALDMPLTISPEELFEQLARRITELDNGKGVLMLVDMGSLNMMETKLMKATGTKIKTIPNVTTSMVLDTVRKVNYMDLELRAIYDSVKKDFLSSINLQENSHGKRKAIISICTTGSGTAQKIETLLEGIIHESTDDSIQVVTVSALQLKSKIPLLQKQYQIIASVGTKNPQLEVPHVSLEQLIEGTGEQVIRQLLGVTQHKVAQASQENMVAKELCEDTLKMYLVYLNPYHIADLLLDWINDVQMDLGSTFSNVSIIKLLVHTAFAFERVIKGNQINYEEEIRSELTALLKIVDKTISVVETQLELYLSQDEKLFISEVLLEC